MSEDELQDELEKWVEPDTEQAEDIPDSRLAWFDSRFYRDLHIERTDKGHWEVYGKVVPDDQVEDGDDDEEDLGIDV